MDARVTVETERQEAVATEILKRIIRYNTERAGEPNDVRLVLSVRDSESNLIGGLVALGLWNGLFVDLLWVSESHRGRGIGKALLSTAEAKARENGWQVCFLSTFDFQAPGFYLKLGYKQIGE